MYTEQLNKIVCNTNFSTVGEPAYVMLTWDIEWSTALFNGHEKFNQDKIQKV